MTGIQILDMAKQHIGEPYILGSLAPKNNAAYKRPWDCAELISWVVYQLSGKLYGCKNSLANPATADAYTGYWRDDAESLGKIIPVDVFGANTLKAVEAFQTAKDTATALGITL